jgi:hypothetical protein
MSIIRSRILKCSLALALIFSSPFQASASFPGDAIRRAVRAEVKAVKDDLLERRYAERTTRTIDAIIEVATRALRERGFEQDASVLEVEWQGWLRRAVSILEVGDHAPFSEWLARVYANLEEKLGHSLLVSLRIDDLNTLNFAIPVVFSPTGWSRDEYRLHFVPFSAIVSYWGVRIACDIAVSGLWGWSCGKVADVPRIVMTRWLGPKLSDQIHDAANGGESPPAQPGSPVETCPDAGDCLNCPPCPALEALEWSHG